jgi:hypothetical protein
MRLSDYTFFVYVQFQNRESIYSSSARYALSVVVVHVDNNTNTLTVKCAMSWPKFQTRLLRLSVLV